jgi:hypothetical protein
LDPVILLVIIIVIVVASTFNFVLNRAPGSDPEDFRVGPPELGITCDCFLIPLIVSGIVVIGMSISAGVFASRMELYLSALIAFFTITYAGFLGRRARYRDWREITEVLERAIPIDQWDRGYDPYIDTFPEDEDDEEFSA